MSGVVWGYCRFCNKEVEVQGGVLIHHLETYLGPRCPGSGGPPSKAPREGAWKPPLRPALAVPDPVGIVDTPAAAAATVRTWRDVIRSFRG